MKQAGGWPLTAWLTTFRLLRRYHRYEVVNLEPLLRPGAKLIVGYHGRPLAVDLCMLTVTLHERLGYLPHGVAHGAFNSIPGMRTVADGLGFVTGDDPRLAEAVARGEHVLLQPGGTREGCRDFRHRYRVDWGERMGYLRLAVRYRLPIVPVGGSGMDDAYVGLNDGYALGQRVGMPARLPLWLGVGATGLWPLSLPFPVKMTQWVGEPLTRHLEPNFDAGNRDAMRAVHQEVADAVQGLLDRARDVDKGSTRKAVQ
ncbi:MULTISPECIES: lysophospholipid acyltransferase family protein [Myxococcus]|uniref:lysophospholipid acyltransferase family protein n=1 Tax=Myxococcus TaxID=32 RepID=UPI0011267272|nr:MULTISPECIES: lysophospholipid acyltransferase family protein [Myxococcus]QDE86670.1 acyltransferase [Myxococcus xanthus]QDF08671.1 acyltransferase [Myxococcus xanthus]WAM26286.1 lysophospholipid acyltransferase family protein [Myxococcus sp. NMCA1]